MLSVTFGVLAFGGVLCLMFPWLLTTPGARPLYPLGLLRALIHAFLVAAFGLGALSVVLRRRRTLGLTGLTLAVAAALVGGADVPVGAMRETPAYLGLAWIDRLFGSAYLPPDRWPAAYGVAGSPVPDGWLRQLVLPFRR